VAAAALLLSTALQAAADEPRRVLLLHSYGPHFAPWSAVSGRFREELIKQSPNAIDLYEASLETARLAQAPDEIPLVEYLRSLYAGRDLNLVVTMGAPAARFVQRYRTQVFAATPLLITGTDQRFISTAALTWNDTAVASTIDLSKLIENVFQLLPDTNNFALPLATRRWNGCGLMNCAAHRKRSHIARPSSGGTSSHSKKWQGVRRRDLSTR
jgi:hypothetical protein